MSASVTAHLNHLALATYDTVSVLAQQQQGGPLGPEFGKASPIGWLTLVAFGVLILTLGWAFHRRFSRFNRRKKFAEEHGLDVFDEEALDRAMEEEGLLDRRKKTWF